MAELKKEQAGSRGRIRGSDEHDPNVALDIEDCDKTRTLYHGDPVYGPDHTRFHKPLASFNMDWWEQLPVATDQVTWWDALQSSEKELPDTPRSGVMQGGTSLARFKKVLGPGRHREEDTIQDTKIKEHEPVISHEHPKTPRKEKSFPNFRKAFHLNKSHDGDVETDHRSASDSVMPTLKQIAPNVRDKPRMRLPRVINSSGMEASEAISRVSSDAVPRTVHEDFKPSSCPANIGSAQPKGKRFRRSRSKVRTNDQVVIDNRKALGTLSNGKVHTAIRFFGASNKRDHSPATRGRLPATKADKGPIKSSLSPSKNISAPIRDRSDSEGSINSSDYSGDESSVNVAKAVRIVDHHSCTIRGRLEGY